MTCLGVKRGLYKEGRCILAKIGIAKRKGREHSGGLCQERGKRRRIPRKQRIEEKGQVHTPPEGAGKGEKCELLRGRKEDCRPSRGKGKTHDFFTKKNQRNPKKNTYFILVSKRVTGNYFWSNTGQ